MKQKPLITGRGEQTSQLLGNPTQGEARKSSFQLPESRQNLNASGGMVEAEVFCLLGVEEENLLLLGSCTNIKKRFITDVGREKKLISTKSTTQEKQTMVIMY